MGFAYRIPGSEKTVVRGGAGIFYGSTVSNSIGDVASLGFSTQSSLVVSQADYQSAIKLSDGFPTVIAELAVRGGDVAAACDHAAAVVAALRIPYA